MEKGLRTGKNLILPKIDRIEDPETKKVLEDILRVLQDMNYSDYNDHTYLDERLKDLEEA